MREIVGANLSGTITNKLSLIMIHIRGGGKFELYDRKLMQFMDACDLGGNWKKMANGPTLFFLDEDGKPIWSGQ